MTETLTNALIWTGAISLTAVTGFIAGAVWCQRSVKQGAPVKRINEGLNAEEKLRLFSQKNLEAIQLRAALIAIRNHFTGQQSGTAKLAVKMAKEGLSA